MLMPASRAGPMHESAVVGKLVNAALLSLQLQLQQGLVVRLLQTERWRITMSLSRGINTKSSIK